jgi:hypothetical protein
MRRSERLLPSERTSVTPPAYIRNNDAAWAVSDRGRVRLGAACHRV